MGGDHEQRDGHQPVSRQTNKRRQQNHRKPQAADHAKHAPAGMECPGKANHREFQHHQPNAARDQKLLQASRRMPRSVKICTDTDEKKECRGAEVSDPPDQKVKGPGLVDVLRFEGDVADEIARMVEGHEDHRQPTNKVDGANTLIALVSSLEVGILNGSVPFSALNFLEL